MGKKRNPPTPPTVPENPETPPETERGRGRPTDFKPEYVAQAAKLVSLGQTDAEIAEFFDVAPVTIWRWKDKHPDFCSSLTREKASADDLVERSLFQRATGYSHSAVKIFMPANAKEPVIVQYVEHIPPDPGAAKLWLCNRRPEQWRDRSQIDVNANINTGLAGRLEAARARAKAVK